jgi:hypothetical protein
MIFQGTHGFIFLERNLRYFDKFKEFKALVEKSDREENKGIENR